MSTIIENFFIIFLIYYYNRKYVRQKIGKFGKNFAKASKKTDKNARGKARAQKQLFFVDILPKIIPRAVRITGNVLVFVVDKAVCDQKDVHSELARDHILANVVADH